MKPKNVIVIGGGASGMMAAIIARGEGANVTLLERNPRVGKKILATGNGRCNFTNINTDVTYFHGENPAFVHSALAQFGVRDTISFFEKLGIAHKVEDLGKVFPMSDQASSVLDVLRYKLETLNVKLVCDAFVKGIKKKKKFFTVTLANGETYPGDAVIITTGGKAMPSTGSDGNGYDLAHGLGHAIIPTFPGLVQLKLNGDYFKQIQGVKFLGTAEILHENASLVKDRGDLLFANYGISGPPILQLSRKANELIRMGLEAVIKITIVDTKTTEELREMLASRFLAEPQKTIEFSLVGLVNKRLIPVLLKEAKIPDPKRAVNELPPEEREKILRILQDWRFAIRGSKGWPSAQVTCGGVNTEGINASTMESKILPGLFFAGEVMDIDGQCGGFNLQWAWSSGYVAGLNAANG